MNDSATSLTNLANGNFLINNSVDFWYSLISFNARVPGLYLLFTVVLVPPRELGGSPGRFWYNPVSRVLDLAARSRSLSRDSPTLDSDLLFFDDVDILAIDLGDKSGTQNLWVLRVPKELNSFGRIQSSGCTGVNTPFLTLHGSGCNYWVREWSRRFTL